MTLRITLFSIKFYQWTNENEKQEELHTSSQEEITLYSIKFCQWTNHSMIVIGKGGRIHISTQEEITLLFN